MKRTLRIISLVIILLSACGLSTPIDTPTPSPTSSPTSTSAPTATASPTPIPPLEGRLFFDMNGSGLQDETSFTYDPQRLADPRQPLHPDLVRALDAYLAAHPQIADGDLVTLAEPGLSGYTVCIKEDCVQTDTEGNFSIPNLTGASSSSLQITDPHADDPALAMRYINHWKGPVTVPAYTKGVDEGTMARLTTIPGCDIDQVALVCKLDDVTLQVRDQQLQDTVIIPLIDGIRITLGVENIIGLMQGFLTFPLEKGLNIWLWSYVDLNYNLGIIENYQGNSKKPNYMLKTSGTGDQHQGIDWELIIGTYLISVAQGEVISVYEGDEGNTAKQIRILFQPGDKYGYTSDYGHNSVNLLNSESKVFRGQIIGLSGNSGSQIPHLHFGIFQVSKYARDNSWVVENIFLSNDYPKVLYESGDLVPSVHDPFRNLFEENSISIWTCDNLPQFSR